jgi:hypothetical protein
VQGLLDAILKKDDRLFATHVEEFDSVIRVDGWRAKILVAAKRR